MTTSSTQWSWFSMPQWLCTMALIRSGATDPAEQVISGLLRRLAGDLMDRGDFSGRLEARPCMAVLQPFDIGAQACRSGLDATMPLVGIAGAFERGLGIIEEAAHVVVQRLLVALEGEHIPGRSMHGPQDIIS